MISSKGPVGGLHLLVPAPHAAVQERADIRPFCDDGHALSRRAPFWPPRRNRSRRMRSICMPWPACMRSLA